MKENVISFNKGFLIALILFSAADLSWAGESTCQDSIEVYKIWDKGIHNGFPDLFRFKNTFYCTFREGNSHVDSSNSGKVRVIRSSDGKNWESVALFEIQGWDVREARLTLTPEGRILATAAAGVRGVVNRKYLMLDPYVSFSDTAGLNFSPLKKPVIDFDIYKPTPSWIWRVTWNEGLGYGIIYQRAATGQGTEVYLVVTDNGKRYEKIAKLDVDGFPTESTIRFDKNNRMYVLVRRETEDQMGVLAESDFPYTDWTYNKLKWRLGGPNFLFLNEKQLIIGSRGYEGIVEGRYVTRPNNTSLYVTDLKGNAQKTIKLPSGGDTSYPGMVVYENKLWIAYYSSHEEKSNIYMAVVPLKLFD